MAARLSIRFFRPGRDAPMLSNVRSFVPDDIFQLVRKLLNGFVLALMGQSGVQVSPTKSQSPDLEIVPTQIFHALFGCQLPKCLIDLANIL